MIEVIKTLRKVREVLRVNNRRLLLLSLLHRPILPPCCLFATGTLGAVFFVAGLQRSSELLGLRQRLCARGRAPRFFLGERDVRRRDQPMKTVVLVFSLAPLFGANVSSTACGKLNAAGREITPEAQLYENAEPKAGYFFLPFRFAFFLVFFFAL